MGYYDLSIAVTAITVASGPFEPNEALLEATPSGLAGPGQVTLSAYLGDGQFAATRGDVDFYEVEATQGQWLTVDVDAAVMGSDLDSVVVVFDYLGKVVAANDNDGTTTDSLVAAEAIEPTDTTPATLYVMVLGTGQARPADPFFQPNPDLVVEAWPSTGAYDLTLTLSDSPDRSLRPALPPALPPPPTEPRSRRLFATELDFPSNTIVELDPADGSAIASLPIPESSVTAGQGLAAFNEYVLYMGTARFPRLYWLDADSGEVYASVILWAGSGIAARDPLTDLSASGAPAWRAPPSRGRSQCLATAVQGRSCTRSTAAT